MIKVPCKGCENRSADCHARCQAYAEYVIKNTAIRVARQNAEKVNQELIAVHLDGVRRANRSKRKGGK